MRFSLKPSNYLKIHCWGGLGSQMYAWALLERLHNNFPDRKFKLVFHTGGVTKRSPDLEPLFMQNEKDFVQDFESNKKETRNEPPSDKLIFAVKKNLVKIIKQILVSTGFVASLNNEIEFSKLKPWVVSVRGHYSELRIDLETINLMRTRAEDRSSGFRMNIEQNTNLDVLHYRLGDLLALAEKSPIDSKRISNAIQSAKVGRDRDLWVLSDSPSHAVDLLKREDPQIKIKIDDGSLNAWQTLMAMSNANIFIGTSSKLSTWAIIFRSLLLEDATSYIPTDVRHHVVANLADSALPRVHFY
jgi:hypothetical protein